MSEQAPWIRFSVDTMESSMFDEATAGERLAWVYLLTHTKLYGRGGHVKLDQKRFADRYRLSLRAVEGMTKLTIAGGALILDGTAATVKHWDVYQNRRGRGAKSASGAKRATSATAPTLHPPPSTINPPPRTDPDAREVPAQAAAANVAEPGPGRAGAWGPLIAAAGRWKGANLTASEEHLLGTFADSLRVVGETVDGNYRLVTEAIEAAMIAAASWDPVKGRNAYVRSIVERCRRDGVRPGDAIATDTEADGWAVMMAERERQQEGAA